MNEKEQRFKKAYYDTMDQICSELSVEHWGIYMWIFRHYNIDTGLCCPSISTLAKECNVSESSMKRKINDLEEKGYIKHNSGKLGKLGEKNLANTYFIGTKDKERDNLYVNTVAESLAYKKKKAYTKKDKYDCKTNTDADIKENSKDDDNEIDNEDPNINIDINMNSTNENYNKQMEKGKHFLVFNIKLAKYLMNNGAECVDIVIDHEIKYEGNMIFYFVQNKELEKLINKYTIVYCN